MDSGIFVVRNIDFFYQETSVSTRKLKIFLHSGESQYIIVFGHLSVIQKMY